MNKSAMFVITDRDRSGATLNAHLLELEVLGNQGRKALWGLVIQRQRCCVRQAMRGEW